MKKLLFLIHDLGHGGAEKVLVNLVNHMDPQKFDITVIALFGGGVNEQFLKPHIHYRTVFSKPFRGNSHFMKLFSSKQLHSWIVKEHYDIEIAYLEGPSARIISGCLDNNTKLVSWIHSNLKSPKQLACAFCSYNEAKASYTRFHKIIGVSQTVVDDFKSLFGQDLPMEVLYNTNESDRIIQLSNQPIPDRLLSSEEINLVGVGKLVHNKGFHRIIPIIQKLRNEGIPAHLYLLGEGPMRGELEALAQTCNVSDAVTFLGYQTNPYRYVKACDLYVCSSYSEGFSTAATEALIVGTPVCTVEVSGMREMLGNNEYGVICENKDEALYNGIKRLLTDSELLTHYKRKADQRGNVFSSEKTVTAVEEMLLNLYE